MSYIDDLADYLEDQGHGTVGTDIFVGHMPDSPTDLIAIYAITPGVTPDKYIPTADPEFQILVRNNEYNTGEAKVDALVAELHQLANVELQAGQTYLYAASLRHEPVHIGRDDEGRDEWSINIVCRLKR